ncbi:MAG: hypothetical protein V4481_02740 [Patescibacteria group bacterium]
MQIYSPVLLAISHHPDNAWRIFEILKNVKPELLYIHSLGEYDLQRMLGDIDWPCKVITNISKNENVSPLAWFFSQAEEGIILQDSCIPDPSFLLFAQSMLERYRDKRSVLTASGANVAGIWKAKHSYFFSQKAIGAGWATWKRAWVSNPKNIEKIFSGEIEDWARTEYLNIVPKQNLIEHIDGGPRGLGMRDDILGRIPCTPLKLPYEHQLVFKVDTSYDAYFVNKFSKTKRS